MRDGRPPQRTATGNAWPYKPRLKPSSDLHHTPRTPSPIPRPPRLYRRQTDSRHAHPGRYRQALPVACQGRDDCLNHQPTAGTVEALAPPLELVRPALQLYPVRVQTIRRSRPLTLAVLVRPDRPDVGFRPLAVVIRVRGRWRPQRRRSLRAPGYGHRGHADRLPATRAGWQRQQGRYAQG